MATARRKKIEHLWWLESPRVDRGVRARRRGHLDGAFRDQVFGEFPREHLARLADARSRGRLSPLLEQLGRARTRPGAARWSFWRRS